MQLIIYKSLVYLFRIYLTNSDDFKLSHVSINVTSDLIIPYWVQEVTIVFMSEID